ncbi:uroporphyrin-III C-methyltransferase [compost metagenome]
MGVAKLHDMSSQLLTAGMAADTPVAMIERASLTDQRECRSTLAAMTHDADAFRLRSPAVLVIGQVAACQMFGAGEAQWPARAEPALRRQA